MTDPGFRILHEDAALLVVDKACGLLTVPGIGPAKADCLIARLQRRWPTARVVHRLDRDTSGVLVVALDPETHRSLSMQFEARETAKCYVALAAGHPPKDAGEIDLPMCSYLVNAPLQIVDFVHGRPSVTRWRVLERLREPDRTRFERPPSRAAATSCACTYWPLGTRFWETTCMRPPQSARWRHAFACMLRSWPSRIP